MATLEETEQMALDAIRSLQEDYRRAIEPFHEILVNIRRLQRPEVLIVPPEILSKTIDDAYMAPFKRGIDS